MAVVILCRHEEGPCVPVVAVVHHILQVILYRCGEFLRTFPFVAQQYPELAVVDEGISTPR